MLVAPEEKLKRRTYNVTAMSFSPEEIVTAVRKHFPDLKATYKPDSRQNIGELLICIYFQRKQNNKFYPL